MIQLTQASGKLFFPVSGFAGTVFLYEADHLQGGSGRFPALMPVFATNAFAGLLFMIYGQNPEYGGNRHGQVQLEDAIGDGAADIVKMRGIAPDDRSQGNKSGWFLVGVFMAVPIILHGKGNFKSARDGKYGMVHLQFIQHGAASCLQFINNRGIPFCTDYYNTGTLGYPDACCIGNI